MRGSLIGMDIKKSKSFFMPWPKDLESVIVIYVRSCYNKMLAVYFLAIVNLSFSNCRSLRFGHFCFTPADQIGCTRRTACTVLFTCGFRTLSLPFMACQECFCLPGTVQRDQRFGPSNLFGSSTLFMTQCSHSSSVQTCFAKDRASRTDSDVCQIPGWQDATW